MQPDRHADYGYRADADRIVFAAVYPVCHRARYLSYAQILSWVDLPWYLAPTTNIATGQIVTLSRSMLRNQIFNWGNLVYSLALAAAELFAACLLFVRRPSEIAEHGAKNMQMQTLYACLLTLPIVLLLASGAVNTTSQNILLVLAVALGCFVAYQIVVLRNGRKVLKSLRVVPDSGASFGQPVFLRAGGRNSRSKRCPHAGGCCLHRVSRSRPVFRIR
jgi:hypothetical protein